MKGSKILESKLSCKSILEHCTLQTVYNSMLKDQSNAKNILAKELIEMAFNSKDNQLVLCRLLNLPYETGCISINAIPARLFGKLSELKSIMDQLRAFRPQAIRQNRYACWVVTVVSDSNELQLVLLAKHELRRNIGLLDCNNNLIGIFVSRQLLKLEAVSAYRTLEDDRIEDKTTKTTVTNNTDNTIQTQPPRRRRKSKGRRDGSLEKDKSASLKLQRKHKSKSNKELSTTYVRSPKNKSVCHLRQPLPTKHQPNQKLACFEQKIMKRKIPEDSRRPALYKKKMELAVPIRLPKHLHQ